MRRSVRVLPVVFACVTAAVAPDAIRSQKAGSRALPVYVQPIFRVWTMHLDGEPGVIVDALERLGEKSKAKLARLPGEKSVYRFEKRKLDSKELDEYCDYPVRNLNTWEPVRTFRDEFRHAVTSNRRREWDARVRLDFHIPSDRDGALVVASSCYLFLFHRGGGVLTTSKAVYERTLLENLAAALQPDAPVVVEPLPLVEPNLAGMGGDQHRISTECGYTGVFMNPQTGEVSCTPPKGMNLVDGADAAAAGEKRSTSTFSIQEAGAQEPPK